MKDIEIVWYIMDYGPKDLNGITWPHINNQQGNWFLANLQQHMSLHGLEGYKINPSISMILGDGLYKVLNVLTKSVQALVSDSQKVHLSTLPVLHEVHMAKQPIVSYDDDRRTEHFILVVYALAPVLAFCNAYGCGLTDLSMASTYGKLAIFIFGAWVGTHQGGVLAGLASCGVMLSIVAAANHLMQDFKTGYLTLSSPRSMSVSQVIAMGCVVAPCVFWLFYGTWLPSTDLLSIMELG
ncbi:hypothetical protein ZIOFF_030276 [Zingiber officinale]|uniref:Uncharacterized protein n=1 Tax=Zingiber officinale TaxID=94328 RepID=A0A8J5GQW6_ZINOF|nr:hypothetical protein ZIOFF_030276 [Zingiber officinale]